MKTIIINYYKYLRIYVYHLNILIIYKLFIIKATIQKWFFGFINILYGYLPCNRPYIYISFCFFHFFYLFIITTVFKQLFTHSSKKFAKSKF